MSFVELNRRFVAWADQKEIDPDIWAVIGAEGGRLTWANLLDRKRVVLLAEAGSGKSTELEERARIWGADHPTFFATVQDVGRHGLIEATGRKAALEGWLASDAPGWFFVDSVDEAKLDNIRLDTALRRLADVLEPHLGRAHIVLSGRHTDWEFQRDLKRFDERLPIPIDQDLPEPTTDELLAQVLHNQVRKEEKKKAEAPLVVLMAALDEEQIRAFAKHFGVTDLDAFVDALGRANLMAFARRPLDLQWLAQYWTRHKRFGAYAEMLEQSIAERLREPDPQRKPLDAARTRKALERVGATLVLGQAKTITIPDSEISVEPVTDALSLDDVLPDWEGGDRQRLARLPVFDPATFGRARLHNDNEGVVRAYLTAGWIRDLRSRNCPPQVIFDLLFADIHGERLVRPSMHETAAWLALTEPDLARELIAREPLVLLNGGDPGSLRKAIKEEALARFLPLLQQGDPFIRYDDDALRRFATADLADAVRAAWDANKDNAKVAAFVLRLIWLGDIKTCADIAVEASKHRPRDRHVEIFAGRALAATASNQEKADYAAAVVAEAADMEDTAVWDAIDALFPEAITVADLLTIVGAIDLEDTDSLGDLESRGEDWVERLSDSAALAALIDGLMTHVVRPYGDPHAHEQAIDRQLYPALAAAAVRLLRLAPATVAPQQAIDVAVRFGDEERGYHRRDGKRDELGEALRQSPQRRRAAFWRAAERLQDARYLNGDLDKIWMLEFVGWNPGLKLEDIDWLLIDTVGQTQPSRRALGIDGAMHVWASNGKDVALLDRIRAVTQGDAVMDAAIVVWTTPPKKSPELERLEERHEEAKRTDAQRKKEITQSWKEFADELRADPSKVRSFGVLKEDGGIDARFNDLWKFLSSANRGRNRYGIDTTDGLRGIFGPEVAAAAADAFSDFWRRWTPKIHSARAPDKRSVSFTFDTIAIAGVAIEAKRTPDWPQSVAADDARRAAQFATLEINGFPPFLLLLARHFPDIVRGVLMTEIEAELDASDQRPGILGSIAHADPLLQDILSEALEAELTARPAISGPALNALLEAVIPVLQKAPRTTFADLVIERFTMAANSDDRLEYLGAAFAVDPVRATAAMIARAQAMEEQERADFLQTTMAVYFGMFGGRKRGIASLPFETLETMIRAAYGAIKPTEDRQRRGSYTPDLRDDAESARSRLLEMLLKTPGRATYDLLHKFNNDPNFASRPGRFAELAFDRAAADSEHAPWTGPAVVAFENDFDDTPRTGADLQLLMRRRLEAMQHDLTEGDFAQAGTLRLLPAEREVQNWVADRFRLKQGHAYSIEREPHVVDEKEPDIRARARATDASVSIEIKDMNSGADWTIAQLEEALRDQLCGRYLRDKAHRHGILLLVHRERRPRGWQAPGGSGFWTFEQIVAHLAQMADEIAGEHPEAPDAKIVVLDVAE